MTLLQTQIPYEDTLEYDIVGKLSGLSPLEDTMKHIFLFVVSVLLLVSSAVAVEALDVVITPSAPDTDDKLSAYVDGYEDTTFDFYWMKDGATYKTSTGTSSSLSASYTEAGDAWTVSVWVPESAWYDSYEVGDESVTIAGEAPSTSDGNVVIEPSDPCGDDDLIASVEGYEDTTFDFYWMKDGATYKTSTGTSSKLSDSYTSVGDEWTVVVWVPESAWYDSFEYGSDSVEIQNCAEEEESEEPPTYDGGNLVIEPSDPCDEDNLKAYVDGYETITFDYYWTLNGASYYTSTGPSSTLDDSYTDIGDDWTVTAWVPASSWYDSFEYDSASVEILDCGEEDNTTPRAADIYFIVEEGDMVDVDLVQYTDFGSYLIAAAQAMAIQTQDVPAYDADGDVLAIAFSYPLNLGSGQWQTDLGDAGVYEVMAIVGDAQDYEEVMIEITVEAVDVVVDTEAPLATDIFFTVSEGDLTDVEVISTDSYSLFLLADYVNSIYEGTNIYVYDADSTESDLTYSFSSPLDAHGDWQTVVGDEGSYTSDFTVTDADGNTGSATISITVEAETDEPCTDTDADGICDEDECVDSDANGVCDEDECEDLNANGICDSEEENTAPVLEDIADIEINEGESLSVTAVASDADGDSLIYSFSTPGGSVSGSTWDWTTTYSDAGQYDVLVSVSDGLASDSTSFTVKVNDVCDDFDADNVCDEAHRSDYEGDLLTVDEIRILNADSLYSAYDVSDMDLETSGVFFVDDGYLHSTGSDNEIKVYLAMHNRNSFDADDISVTFILDGEEYNAGFSDLDRSEEQGQIYSISIPEDLETGKYALRVLVESDDISYEKAFNLRIVSLGEYIAQPVAEEEEPVTEAVASFIDKVKEFLAFLF